MKKMNTCFLAQGLGICHAGFHAKNYGASLRKCGTRSGVLPGAWFNVSQLPAGLSGVIVAHLWLLIR